MTSRILVFIYGIVAYALFLGAFLHAINFLGYWDNPISMIAREEAPFGTAIFIDMVLLSLFALQHSIMARLSFKKWWTKIMPEHLERSTYVLLASLCLFLMFFQWRSMDGVIWDVENLFFRNLLSGLFWVGWLTVLLSTFMTSHFDLFGLRQVTLYLRGRKYTPIEFNFSFFYKHIRHPIMLGFIIAFWATPTMTADHLLFALVTTVYILIAIQLEERDLISIYGEGYQKYCREVSMLVPFPKKNQREGN